MPRKTSGTFQEIWDFAKTVIWAGVIAILIRTFFYEPFNIPSKSMVPTLLVGDYLFVSKTSYGYSKFSFPLSLIPFKGRIWSREPKRGDVVVFRPPGEIDTDFIKRLIGLPGDRIQVRRGRLYINGEEVQRQEIEDYVDPEELRCPCKQYIETLPGGVVHHIIEINGDMGSFDDTPVYVVPADHYFMMGDDRDNSDDSRAFVGRSPSSLLPTDEITSQNGDLLGPVGFVPKENLIGPAKVLFFSWSKPFQIRWSRLFNLVK